MECCSFYAGLMTGAALILAYVQISAFLRKLHYGKKPEENSDNKNRRMEAIELHVGNSVSACPFNCPVNKTETPGGEAISSNSMEEPVEVEKKDKSRTPEMSNDDRELTVKEKFYLFLEKGFCEELERGVEDPMYKYARCGAPPADDVNGERKTVDFLKEFCPFKSQFTPFGEACDSQSHEDTESADISLQSDSEPLDDNRSQDTEASTYLKPKNVQETETADASSSELQNAELLTQFMDCCSIKDDITDLYEKDDTTTSMTECDKEDTATSVTECDKEDTTTSVTECDKEDTTSSVTECDKEDTTTNMTECDKEDTITSMTECDKEDTTASMTVCNKEDTTNMTECDKEDTTTNMTECDKEDTTTNMTESEKEAQVREEQVATIINLLASRQDRFGIHSLDDFNAQLKIYM